MKKLKIFLISIVSLCALAGILFLSAMIWIATTTRLSDEELRQQIPQQIAQDVQKFFDEKYDAQVKSCQVEILSLEVGEHPEFALVYGETGKDRFVYTGTVDGEIDLIIDCPDLYQYLEKNRYSYELADLRELNRIKEAFVDELCYRHDMSKVVGAVDYYTYYLERSRTVFLDSEGNEYTFNLMEWDGFRHGYIDKNGEEVFETYMSNGSGGSGGTCSRCNGTGTVRYNYGSSDLEAVLSGHDPYTYGQCGSCGGTGRAG